MIDKIEKAIEALAVKSMKAETHAEAMQYSQAVCNLANALITVKNAETAGLH